MVPFQEKVICTDEDVISKEEIYSRFAIIGLFLTAVLCLVPLGQLIEISVRTQLLIYPVSDLNSNEKAASMLRKAYCKILMLSNAIKNDKLW